MQISDAVHIQIGIHHVARVVTGCHAAGAHGTPSRLWLRHERAVLRHQHDRRADDVAAALIAECRAAHEHRDAFRLRHAGWQTRAGKDFSAIQRLLQGAAYQHIVEGRLVVVDADAVDHPRLPASTRDHDVPVALKPRQQVDRRLFEVIHFALQKDRHARRGVGQGEHLRTLDAHDLSPCKPIGRLGARHITRVTAEIGAFAGDPFLA